MRELAPTHVFFIDETADTGEHHHYAAASAEEALALYVDDVYGGSVEDYRLENPNTVVTQEPDERLLTIWLEQGCTDEAAHYGTRTMAEWAAIVGHGCVASTFYSD